MSGAYAVTALVPTFNRASLVSRAVRSILEQTWPVHEVVVVDDGSEDDTREQVGALIAAQPTGGTRIRYQWQPNQGKCAAINSGLRFVLTPWVAFLDSDDVWLPEKVALQMQALSLFADCGVSFTDARFANNASLPMTAFERTGARYPGNMGRVPEPHHLFLDTVWPGIHMPTMIVRKELLDRLGGLDRDLPLEHDTDLVFRLGQVTGFCYVNLPLAVFDRTERREVGLVTQHPIGGSARLLELEKAQRRWCRLVEWTDPVLHAVLKDRLRSTQHKAFRELFPQPAGRKEARAVLMRGLIEHRDPRFLVKWLLSYVAPRALRDLVASRSGVVRS